MFVTTHEDLSLPIERLGGGKFNVMKFAKPILSPRNMIRIIEGVMESGRGRGREPPPSILIVISFSYNWRAPSPPPLV